MTRSSDVKDLKDLSNRYPSSEYPAFSRAINYFESNLVRNYASGTSKYGPRFFRRRMEVGISLIESLVDAELDDVVIRLIEERDGFPARVHDSVRNFRSLFPDQKRALILALWSVRVPKLRNDGRADLAELVSVFGDANYIPLAHYQRLKDRSLDPETIEPKIGEIFPPLGSLLTEDDQRAHQSDDILCVEPHESEKPQPDTTVGSSQADDLISLLQEASIAETTRESLVLSRVGQGQFRKDVLELWGNQCAVTGTKTLAAIRASHIKPWSESDNDDRLDPHNGIPLVATLDALFDARLISFDETGAMLVSEMLDPCERELLGVGAEVRIHVRSARMAENFKWHRERLI